MKKSEMLKSVAQVHKIIMDNGGRIVERFTLIERPNKGLPWEMDTMRMVIPTRAGDLQVTPYGDWIACCFVDPVKALEVCGKDDTRLNPYSGKWNFHAHGITEDCRIMIDVFIRELGTAIMKPLS